MMKPVHIVVAIVVVVVIAATIYMSTRSAKKSYYETGRQLLESRGIRLGPIRHTGLPPELVERIRRLQEVFAEVYPISRQEWLDGFQRDQTPEDEVAIWDQMASAYTTFLNENELDAAGRREAFRLLLIRSRTANVESQFSNLSHLTLGQAKSLLALYGAAPKPITFQDGKQAAAADEDRPRR